MKLLDVEYSIYKKTVVIREGDMATDISNKISADAWSLEEKEVDYSNSETRWEIKARVEKEIRKVLKEMFPTMDDWGRVH